MASTSPASPPTPGSKLNSGEEVQKVNVHLPSSKENVSIVSNFNNNNVK